MTAASATWVNDARRLAAPQSAPMQRWLVTGRAWTGDRYELGYFLGRTSTEAIRECRRRKGDLCAGLSLQAEARL